MNMNPGILQCKNYWKQSHITFIYYTYRAKCQRYNSLYKLEHHREIVWYCKANFKTNPSKLEIKKGESCTHLFKYTSCKDEYQMDSNNCLFWKHRFNRNLYNKELQKL